MSATALVGFAVVSILAVAGFVVFQARKAEPESAKPERLYKAKVMLSANELEFLNRLEAAVPECRFCPQVAMSALLEPDGARKNRRGTRGTYAQKIIDFVMQDKATGAVIAIIELDDRTHDKKKEKDAQRDEMLNSAGYRTVRWDSRAKPDLGAIRAQLLASESSSQPLPGKKSLGK